MPNPITATAVYPTIAAYYAERPERRWSEEADYGVHWRLDGWPL